MVQFIKYRRLSRSEKDDSTFNKTYEYVNIDMIKQVIIDKDHSGKGTVTLILDHNAENGQIKFFFDNLNDALMNWNVLEKELRENSNEMYYHFDDILTDRDGDPIILLE